MVRRESGRDIRCPPHILRYSGFPVNYRREVFGKHGLYSAEATHGCVTSLGVDFVFAVGCDSREPDTITCGTASGKSGSFQALCKVDILLTVLGFRQIVNVNHPADVVNGRTFCQKK
ncbi:MAG: hypothetical protein ACRC2T_13690 [Thermoguttaceae bacterium]